MYGIELSLLLSSLFLKEFFVNKICIEIKFKKYFQILSSYLEFYCTLSGNTPIFRLETLETGSK